MQEYDIREGINNRISNIEIIKRIIELFEDNIFHKMLSEF
jgi:hypothetical protein